MLFLICGCAVHWGRRQRLRPAWRHLGGRVRLRPLHALPARRGGRLHPEAALRQLRPHRVIFVANGVPHGSPCLFWPFGLDGCGQQLPLRLHWPLLGQTFRSKQAGLLLRPALAEQTVGLILILIAALFTPTPAHAPLTATEFRVTFTQRKFVIKAASHPAAAYSSLLPPAAHAAASSRSRWHVRARVVAPQAHSVIPIQQVKSLARCIREELNAQFKAQ